MADLRSPCETRLNVQRGRWHWACGCEGMTELPKPTPALRSPRPDVVPPDRGIPRDRAFVNDFSSDDPLAEEMGEESVRAMTSGEDETLAEGRDGVAPNLDLPIDETETLTEGRDGLAPNVNLPIDEAIDIKTSRERPKR